MRFENRLWVCFSLLGLTMWIAGCAEGEQPVDGPDAPPTAAPGAPADMDHEAGSTTGGGVDMPAGEEEWADETAVEETADDAADTAEEATDETAEEAVNEAEESADDAASEAEETVEDTEEAAQ